MDLSILPSGTIVVRQNLAEISSDRLPTDLEPITKAFQKDPSSGLFALATVSGSQLSDSASYWRGFAGMFLTALCHVPEETGHDLSTLPKLTPSDHAQLLLSIPPMPGAEYVNAEILDHHWDQLQAWVKEQLDVAGTSLAEFLKKKAPKWHQVGRICFHLAENKKNLERPFAFLATYSRGLSANAKVQHQPLGNALKEYGSAQDKKALIRLLTPVNLASKGSKCIERLIQTGNLYRPLAWKPSDAYHFLKDVSIMEDSGIVVRLPDWWKKRPRPKVGVTVGNEHGQRFDANGLLDFKIETMLNGEVLTEEEIQHLLNAEEGLVLLKGQWVEVNPERLSQALQHWKKVEQECEGGLGFVDGMRLLAGMPQDLSSASKWQDIDQDWSFVNAGDWLGDVVQKLRDPSQLSETEADIGLNASLRPYQKLGVQWLSFLSQLGLGACLADDMGLGKTIQVIAMLLAEQRTEQTMPSLLILPTSLLGNWKSELTKFAPQLRVHFVHPSESSESVQKMKKASLQKLDVVLTSYGMVIRLPWIQETEWRRVILDEAQAIKNPAARQTQAIKKINCKSRIALTGTPLENRLSDMWSLFDFLCPGLLGSLSKFKQFIKQLESRETDRFAPLRSLVQPYILRRLKTDKRIIQDLPDKTEVQAFCSLSRRQALLYGKLVEEMKEALDDQDGIKRRGIVLAYLMRFKQACNHPSQVLGDGIFKSEDSGKFQRLAEICEEIAMRQEKVLIFTQFREMTDPLSDHLTSVFGRSGLVLHGGTAVRSRKKMVDAFQDESGPPFFVLSLKAGGTGLNLTAANHVIHFDRWWNPAVENQATDRAFRIGQKHPVLVHKFVCQGTVEEKIDTLIQSKKQLATDLLEEEDGTNKLLTEMSDQELIRLVSLDMDRSNI